MSKIRVYELAKEFGIDSGQLIERMKTLGIEAANHLSVLSDEDAESVRTGFSNKPQGEVVQKRIRATVIRRRKRRSAPDDDAQAEAEDLAAEADGEAPAEIAPESVDAPAEATAAAEVEPEVTKEREPTPEELARALAEEEAKAQAATPAEPEAAVAVEEPAKEPTPAAAAPAAKVEPKPAETKEAADARPKKLETPPAKPADDKRDTKPKRGKRLIYERKRTSGRRVLLESTDDMRPRGGGRRRKAKKARKTQLTTPKASKRVVRIEESIRVSDLAQAMSVKAAEVIRKLMSNGVMASLNQSLDYDTATLIANEFDYTVEKILAAEEKYISTQSANPEDLVSRPPVVTIMGHVDHGKTSLLDAIQESNITASEAGGITQAIGAYTVNTPSGTVTFIDTPGHEAFTAMRARGAKVTDIVVLIVAADDGIMPQTIEAINHSKDAEVPIIVVINKIDKADADPERVRSSLSEYGLIPEDWGGDTIICEASAKQQIGIDKILEMILLQAEMLELKGNPKSQPQGVVIESRLDKSRGPVCTVLVQSGTLRPGDIVVAGTNYGRIRTMHDDKGVQIEEAGPSIPVEITGLSGVADASEQFVVVSTDREAREIVSEREVLRREALAQGGPKRAASLQDLLMKIQSGETAELKVVLKADVQGSIEAVSGALMKLPNDEVGLKITHSGVGGITESDVYLAQSSSAVILGFNVRSDPSARSLAEREGVEIRNYNVIYDLLDEVKLLLEGMLAPELKEKPLGVTEIRQVFTVTRIGSIAGSFVTEGKVIRGCHVRLYRDNIKVYDGKIASLKRHKDDVKEVVQGYECGIILEKFNDIKVGDILETYEIIEVAKTLD